MSAPMTCIRGWVRSGLVILDPNASALPDGTEVRVTIVPDNERLPIPFTPDEQAEFDAWDKLGDEAWAMIDAMEREDGITGQQIARE